MTAPKLLFATFVLLLSTLARVDSLGWGFRKDVVGTIKPIALTAWGEWGVWEYCPKDQWVTRFQLKSERNQQEGDDTAVNGIKLLCGSQPAGTDGPEVTGRTGPWGQYQNLYHCAKFYTGAEIQSQPPQGGDKDDTAMTNLRLTCSDGFTHEGDGLPWGDWTGSARCPLGSAICGLRTRLEAEQGGGDDTALNAVEFRCCTVKEKSDVNERLQSSPSIFINNLYVISGVKEEPKLTKLPLTLSSVGNGVQNNKNYVDNRDIP